MKFNLLNSGFDIEHFINLIAQKLFPVWYATQAVKEIPMENIEELNPDSFLCHRWLSLISTNEAMSHSLEGKEEWKGLYELLPQLIAEKEYDKKLDISVLKGVESSQYDQPWANLYDYAEHVCQDISSQSKKDFENNTLRAFSQDDAPFHVHYREWDGRYYFANKREPVFMAASLAQLKQGYQYDLTCKLHVESIQSRSLDRLKNGYWLLLMKRESAHLIYQLLAQAELNCQLVEFEWRRNDLCFLAAKRHNMKLNKILVNLLSTHTSNYIIDWPKYLSNHHFPMRNH